MSIVENKKSKSILAFLTIVLILLGIIVPALAAMEQKGRIISFEKASPVYMVRWRKELSRRTWDCRKPCGRRWIHKM